MSEYWVSNAKYYCKYCNCWMADNKPSRTQHDTNPKHKHNVEAFNKKKKEQGLYGARDEDDLKRQLAEIDKAAKSALKDDRIAQTLASSGIAAPQQPSYKPSYKQRQNDESSNRASNIHSGPKDKKSNGFYSVRGQGYLEGEMNEELFVANATCQYFSEEADDWLDSVIVGRKEVSIPHTDLTITTFTIDFKQKDGKWTREEGIKSDKLRLLATMDGDPTELDGTMLKSMLNGVKVTAIKPKINAATGMSGWQTVSVKLIDEEEVERQRILDETKEKEEALAAAKAALATEDSDIKALKVYKGVTLAGPVLIDAGNVCLNGGETIVFRKRKIDSSSNEDSEANQASDNKPKGQRTRPPIRKRGGDDEDDD